MPMAAAALLTVVALLAGWLPARRAAHRTHPLDCRIVLARIARIRHQPVDVPDLDFRLQMNSPRVRFY
jgi:hypothetical protein